MIKAQKKWTKGKTPEQRYKQGNQVWLEGCNLRIDRPSTKLAPKRHGPFKIKKVLSPITYQLELLAQWKIHDVFHADLLLRYCRNIRPTWVKFNSKDTKESGSGFEVLSTKSKKRT